MRYFKVTAAVATALAMSTAPAFAAGAPDGTPHATDNPGTAHQPGGTPTADSNPGSGNRPSNPGPRAGLPAKAKAYGRYCKDQSRKHVDGEKGTAFSRCVTAMAKLATGRADSPREACRTLSKEHVAGERGTPFSRCVSGGAKLLKDQHAQAGDEPAAEQQPAA